MEFDIKKERNLIKEICEAYKNREAERIDRLNAIIKEAENVHLNDLVEEAAEIATVRKDNVFQSEVTNEEKEIIKQRVDLQRKQYQEYIKRYTVFLNRYTKISSHFYLLFFSFLKI